MHAFIKSTLLTAVLACSVSGTLAAAATTDHITTAEVSQPSSSSTNLNASTDTEVRTAIAKVLTQGGGTQEVYNALGSAAKASMSLENFSIAVVANAIISNQPAVAAEIAPTLNAADQRAVTAIVQNAVVATLSADHKATPETTKITQNVDAAAATLQSTAPALSQTVTVAAAAGAAGQSSTSSAAGANAQTAQSAQAADNTNAAKISGQ